jgi:hypothetical protein
MGVGNWAKRVDANVGYLVGSNTWIEKYKELKLCAAELYIQLIAKGYEFTPEESAKFKTRYGEIMNTTDTKERLGDVLRRQYYDDRDNGVENAEEIYLQALVDNGLMTEKDAEKRRMLLNAANVKTVAMPEKEQFVLTLKEINLKIDGLKALDDESDSAKAYCKVYDMISGLFDKFGRSFTADKVRDAWRDTPVPEMAADVIAAFDEAISILRTTKNAPVVDAMKYSVNKEDWDAIPVGEIGVTVDGKAEKKEEYLTITYEDINKKRKEIAHINGDLKSALACRKLYIQIAPIMTEVGTYQKTKKAISDFDTAESSGDVPTPVSAALYIALQEDIDSMGMSVNRPLIASLKHQVKKSEWDLICVV